MLHAARWKCRTQKIAKNSPSANLRTSLLRHIFATKACIDNRKNLLSSNISSTCPHNIVNFGPLVAEIGWQVWVTPANVNGFRVLAASLHGTSSERQLDCGVEQRAPPIFGRLAMTLGIGSHSSYIFISLYHMFGCNQYFLLLCSKNSLFVLFTFSKLRYMNVLLHHFVS